MDVGLNFKYVFVELPTHLLFSAGSSIHLVGVLGSDAMGTCENHQAGCGRALMRSGLRVRFGRYSFRSKLLIRAVDENSGCLVGLVPRADEAMLDVVSQYGVVRLLLYASKNKEIRANSVRRKET